MLLHRANCTVNCECEGDKSLKFSSPETKPPLGQHLPRNFREAEGAWDRNLGPRAGHPNDTLLHSICLQVDAGAGTLSDWCGRVSSPWRGKAGWVLKGSPGEANESVEGTNPCLWESGGGGLQEALLFQSPLVSMSPAAQS
jgi:hypothetical protein